MKRTKAQEAERVQEIAWCHKHMPPGTTISTILDSVSRSGMSRHIRVLLPYKHDNGEIGFFRPNYAVSVITGLRQERRRDGSLGDALVVGGCGMDMGFHVVYNLSYALYKDGFGCIGANCPSNDHSNGDRSEAPHTDAAPHWHSDGGYALKQRWL